MKKQIKKALLEAFALATCLIMVIPLWMVLVSSFKDTKHANQVNLSLEGVSWEQIVANYTEVFQTSGLTTAYINSVIITFFSVLLIILVSSLAAFVIQRRDQKWVKGINMYIIMGMTLPAFIVPTYFLLQKMNLLQTYLGIILVYTACRFPLATFMFTGFYKSIPKELDESAIVDGCNPWQMYFKVIFPLIKPITATVVIIDTLSIWNEFSTALFLISSPKRYTVALTTYAYTSQQSSDWNLLFANIILISLPVIIVYIFLQKHIVSGMTAGAVKG